MANSFHSFVNDAKMATFVTNVIFCDSGRSMTKRFSRKTICEGLVSGLVIQWRL